MVYSQTHNVTKHSSSCTPFIFSSYSSSCFSFLRHQVQGVLRLPIMMELTYHQREIRQLLPWLDSGQTHSGGESVVYVYCTFIFVTNPAQTSQRRAVFFVHKERVGRGTKILQEHFPQYFLIKFRRLFFSLSRHFKVIFLQK